MAGSKKKISNSKPSPGDYVEVSLVKQKYEGVLLETPVSEKGIILLKLSSGYNIAINRKKVLEVKVKKKASEEKEEIRVEKDKSKPNIAMVITGGTIASKLDAKTGGVDPLTKPEELFKFYPGIFEKVNVTKIEVPFLKASEDMDFKDWQKIARVVAKLLNENDIKGIVITHGTDFLHYTSAALSFFLGKVRKPVVLTYSQRSIDRASSDANLNLNCSTLVAISDIAEISVVGHASSNDDFCYVMPGTKVRKMHTSKRDAFKVVNSKPFAKIVSNADNPTIEIISSYNVRDKNNKSRKVRADAKFEEKVALVKVYPGQSPDILDYYKNKGYKGIVLEMSGLGHVPTRKSRNSWLKKLKEVQRKMVVCAAPQTIYGRLDPWVYSNGREIMKTGVIYLEDMLAETALVKLGWVLGHEEWRKNREKVKEKMLENVAGEINDRLEYRD